MSQFDAASYQNNPVAQQYGAMRGQTIGKTQLQDLAKQAVENGTLDAGESAVFQDIASNGTYDKAALADLPPQVQALFSQTETAPVQPAARVSKDGLSLNADPNLSPGRQSMMKALDKVIFTSIQGGAVSKEDRKQGRRNLFDHTEWSPASVAKHGQPKHTSCGLLPGSMLKQIGVNNAKIAGNGTEGVRIEAQRLGIWVTPDAEGKNKPKPGDIYALHYPEPTKPDDNPKDGISHVGVINSIDGDTWTTADAGQGTSDQQQAKLVSRPMTKTKGIPTVAGRPDAGEMNRPREVAGWVDLDRLMFLQTYQDMLCGRTKGDDNVDAFIGVKRQPGFDRSKGLAKEELQALAALALKDGKLDETEKKVFAEIAKQLGGKLSAADLQQLPGFAYASNANGHGTVTLDDAEHLRLLGQSSITQADWDALPEEIRKAVTS